MDDLYDALVDAHEKATSQRLTIVALFIMMAIRTLADEMPNQSEEKRA